MDITYNKLRGNRVGRVFGSDQFKIFLWWVANILAITASYVTSYSAVTTPFDIRVGVACIVTTIVMVMDWLWLA